MTSFPQTTASLRYVAFVPEYALAMGFDGPKVHHDAFTLAVEAPNQTELVMGLDLIPISECCGWPLHSHSDSTPGDAVPLFHQFSSLVIA